MWTPRDGSRSQSASPIRTATINKRRSRRIPSLPAAGRARMRAAPRLPSHPMAKEVYIASVGLTKVDLTGRIFASVFDLFSEAYSRALEDSPVRSFDALQVGIMDSEEFENRANVAAKVADRLGLTGIPAVRSETASSTGAAALHEAYYKIASGECESVLVLAGEGMEMAKTVVATAD